MTSIFDDYPKQSHWFYEKNRIDWREKHEAEILEAINDQKKLKKLKERYITHRGCSGSCIECDTVDWCLFTIGEDKANG